MKSAIPATPSVAATFPEQRATGAQARKVRLIPGKLRQHGPEPRRSRARDTNHTRIIERLTAHECWVAQLL